MFWFVRVAAKALLTAGAGGAHPDGEAPHLQPPRAPHGAAGGSRAPVPHRADHRPPLLHHQALLVHADSGGEAWQQVQPG